MEEKIILNGLNKDSVTISRQQYIMNNGKEYIVSEPLSKGYANSPKGREELKKEVAEPYLSVVLLMWGNIATVSEE